MTVQARAKAPKPNPRKKWRKSVIQLVSVAPPSSQPENTEAPKKAENTAGEVDIPLKLPRTMRSAASNGNPFRVRNSDQPDESAANNKETVASASRSPVRQARTLDEKENYGP